MNEFYTMMNNPVKEVFYRSAIAKGLDHEGFEQAVKRYLKLLDDMDAVLEDQGWLAGSTISLADIALVPYILRLDHLGMAGMWTGKSNVADWYDRMKQRQAWQTAIVDWFVAPAVEGMNRAGGVAWPKVREILDA